MLINCWNRTFFVSVWISVLKSLQSHELASRERKMNATVIIYTFMWTLHAGILHFLRMSNPYNTVPITNVGTRENTKTVELSCTSFSELKLLHQNPAIKRGGARKAERESSWFVLSCEVLTFSYVCADAMRTKGIIDPSWYWQSFAVYRWCPDLPPILFSSRLHVRREKNALRPQYTEDN